jgi:hypothetical protein
MRWIKQGLIFVPDGRRDWMRTHASIPVVDLLDYSTLRVYFAARDEEGRARIGAVDVAADDPRRILHLHDDPILPLGAPGTFDDNGMMPSWLVNFEGIKYLYYIGWNPQVTVSYRLAIGLAVSEDGGRTFRRYALGPICDRDLDEPFFNTAPCVLREDGRWRMWYVSCTGWETINRRPEPRYHIKYAESGDGVHWRRTGLVCVDYDEFTKAIGRPAVVYDNGLYRMWYSYRGIAGYRTDPHASYRLGYAESTDGLKWVRRDDVVGIDRSGAGWDSEMIEYAQVAELRGRWHCFYNGNGFGRSGFGLATIAA